MSAQPPKMIRSLKEEFQSRGIDLSFLDHFQPSRETAEVDNVFSLQEALDRVLLTVDGLLYYRTVPGNGVRVCSDGDDTNSVIAELAYVVFSDGDGVYMYHFNTRFLPERLTGQLLDSIVDSVLEQKRKKLA